MPITTLGQLELAKRVSEHLHAHPEQHDQHIWHLESGCGTTACIAGWTAVLAGARAVTRYDDDGDAYKVAVRPDGTAQEISLYARTMLGLTSEEADVLFLDLSNNADALGYLDQLIAAGEAVAR